MKLKKAKFVSVFLAVVISTGVCAAPGNVVYADSSNSVKASSAEVDVPSNFTYKTTSSTITLSWDAVDGAEAYRVYKYNSSSKKYERYKNVAGNSCTITDLKKGTKYKFKVAVLYKSKRGNSYTEGTVSKEVIVSTNKNDTPVAPSADFTGFVSKNGEKYYYSSGKLVTGWQVIDGSKYYFDSDYSMHTGWLNVAGGAQYFFLTDGKMAKDVTLKIGGISYIFGKSGAADKKGFPEYNKLSSESRKAVDDICLYIDDLKKKHPEKLTVLALYDYKPVLASADTDRRGYWLKVCEVWSRRVNDRTQYNGYKNSNSGWCFLCTGGNEQKYKYGLHNDDPFYFSQLKREYEWGNIDLDSPYEDELEQINKAIAEYVEDKYGESNFAVPKSELSNPEISYKV